MKVNVTGVTNREAGQMEMENVELLVTGTSVSRSTQPSARLATRSHTFTTTGGAAR
jgi:hypothetical protein